jgi:hypothetical protein
MIKPALTLVNNHGNHFLFCRVLTSEGIFCPVDNMMDEIPAQLSVVVVVVIDIRYVHASEFCHLMYG